MTTAAPAILCGVLTGRQAATAANVSEKTIRRAIAAGELPATMAGGSWLIVDSDLYAWRAAHARGDFDTRRRGMSAGADTAAPGTVLAADVPVQQVRTGTYAPRPEPPQIGPLERTLAEIRSVYDAQQQAITAAYEARDQARREHLAQLRDALADRDARIAALEARLDGLTPTTPGAAAPPLPTSYPSSAAAHTPAPPANPSPQSLPRPGQRARAWLLRQWGR